MYDVNLMLLDEENVVMANPTFATPYLDLFEENAPVGSVEFAADEGGAAGGIPRGGAVRPLVWVLTLPTLPSGYSDTLTVTLQFADGEPASEVLNGIENAFETIGPTEIPGVFRITVQPKSRHVRALFDNGISGPTFAGVSLGPVAAGEYTSF